MKSAELTGVQLTAAVAAAAGYEFNDVNGEYPEGMWWRGTEGVFIGDGYGWQPSQLWQHGGPIIEQERIFIAPMGGDEWWAGYEDWCSGCASDGAQKFCGPTPLVAAMRAFVARKSTAT